MKDAARHGTLSCGEVNGQAILNSMQVSIIKYLLRIKEFTQEEIGKIFNVHRTTINNIKTGKYWNKLSLRAAGDRSR